MLALLLSLRAPPEARRIKYFCACDATCVGVLVTTHDREIDLQSPLPNFARPSRNARCSSSDQGMPLRFSPSERGPEVGGGGGWRWGTLLSSLSPLPLPSAPLLSADEGERRFLLFVVVVVVVAVAVAALPAAVPFPFAAAAAPLTCAP